MIIALASDHAGFRYKQVLAAWLPTLGHEVRDFGAHSDLSSDYPDFVMPAARAVARGECDRGIVLGGSGNGEAIAANRVDGIRCVLSWNEESARLGRAHNDANVLALGERLVSLELAQQIVRVWIETPFDGGRHARRLAKLDLRGPGACDVNVVSVRLASAPAVVRARVPQLAAALPPVVRADAIAVRGSDAGTVVLVSVVAARGEAPGRFEETTREVRAAVEAWSGVARQG
jgi:ribose 5-phosphate isomerase B